MVEDKVEKDWTFKYFIRKGYKKLLQKTFIQEYLQLQKLSKNLKIW